MYSYSNKFETRNVRNLPLFERGCRFILIFGVLRHLTSLNVVFVLKRLSSINYISLRLVESVRRHGNIILLGRGNAINLYLRTPTVGTKIVHLFI